MHHPALLTGLLLATSVLAAPPRVEPQGDRVQVTGDGYRALFDQRRAGCQVFLAQPDGGWRDLGLVGPALYDDGEEHFVGRRATWAAKQVGDAFIIGQQVLAPAGGMGIELHTICTSAGLLLGARLPDTVTKGTLWLPGRLALKGNWTGYLFWAPDGRPHAGRLADLQPLPACAGVNTYGPAGDTVASLDPAHPAVIARPGDARDLAAVLVDYATRWRGGASFIQCHTPTSTLNYTGFVPVRQAAQPLWAWLAPIDATDPAAAARQVEGLVAQARALTAGFQSLAPPIPADWSALLADFPAELRRTAPVTDINDALIYTMAETTRHQAALDLHRAVGSEVLVRGWFKWNQAPRVEQWRDVASQARAAGALFGGGITCSALYDTENQITREQLLDLATRGPDGELVDAWGQPGVRHGTLSNPAYLDYLFRWCREQIDAGADYLFMDEINAALGGNEGYDDYSIADFRRFLLTACPQTTGWGPRDARWTTTYRVALDDRAICPSGGIDSLQYRAYLAALRPANLEASASNPLAGLWRQFRAWRDDLAWQRLTTRIRDHARSLGRTVLISGNGLAKYVDLQVLGVWGAWDVDSQRRLSFAENRLTHWRSLVRRGRALVERRVPVVLFHDWGFGEVPFPWMGVSETDRELWLRIRGPEIFAAGGIFAWPVLGPFDCDASRDGTLGTIARQTTFLKRHADLYRQGEYVGSDVVAAPPDLSLAVWSRPDPRQMAVHIINRQVRDQQLVVRRAVTVTVPVAATPAKVEVYSPDWTGARPATWRAVAEGLEVTLPELTAYDVAVVTCTAPLDLSRIKDPTRLSPAGRWAPNARTEFRVLPDGSVEHADDLNAFQQGQLHTDLHTPPTFVVNALAPGQLRVKVRAVATSGARIDWLVDGVSRQTVDLPDRDQSNDANVAEYDEVFTFEIPAGRHRLTLDNTGGDWYTLSWIELTGSFGP